MSKYIVIFLLLKTCYSVTLRKAWSFSKYSVNLNQMKSQWSRLMLTTMSSVLLTTFEFGSGPDFRVQGNLTRWGLQVFCEPHSLAMGPSGLASLHQKCTSSFIFSPNCTAELLDKDSFFQASSKDFFKLTGEW